MGCQKGTQREMVRLRKLTIQGTAASFRRLSSIGLRSTSQHREGLVRYFVHSRLSSIDRSGRATQSMCQRHAAAVWPWSALILPTMHLGRLGQVSLVCGVCVYCASVAHCTLNIELYHTFHNRSVLWLDPGLCKLYLYCSNLPTSFAPHT